MTIADPQSKSKPTTRQLAFIEEMRSCWGSDLRTSTAGSPGSASIASRRPTATERGK